MKRTLAMAVALGAAALGVTGAPTLAQASSSARAEAGTAAGEAKAGGVARAAETAGGVRGTQRRSLYLALGDSLADGVQPNARGAPVATRQGYADVLTGRLLRSRPGLHLVKLGCSGETVRSMIRGGKCRYSRGSQLRTAEAILRRHRGEVALVTIDIGANDVARCATLPAVDFACVTAGVRRISENLPRIASRLRRAAGRRTRIVAMNYYDPFLGLYLRGQTGQAQASLSIEATDRLNAVLRRAYNREGIRVADVSGAFQTRELVLTEPFEGTQLPVAVARICRWTWICTPAPRGPDFHPNAEGYEVIAGAFERALRRR